MKATQRIVTPKLHGNGPKNFSSLIRKSSAVKRSFKRNTNISKGKKTR